MPERLSRALQGLLVLLIACLVVFLLLYYIIPAIIRIINALLPVVLPFLVAALLAALLDPLVNFIQAHIRVNRTAAVLITMSLFLGLASWGLFYLISNLIIELEGLVASLPAQAKWWGAFLQEIFHRLQAFYFSGALPPDILSALQNLLNTAIVGLKGLLTSVIQGLINFLSSLPELFIVVIITLVATFFFSRDKEAIIATLYCFLPLAWARSIESIGYSVGRAIIGVLRAEILLISLQIIQTVIGLLILNVDYALTLAFLIGLADILPIVGPGTIYIPWAVWEFIQGKYGLGVALLVLYSFIILLRQILQPKLIAVNLGLHPLTALIALYAGLKLLGIAGLIIGPLTVVVFKAYIAATTGKR